MSRPATPIVLSESEKNKLLELIKRPKMQRRYADRARIVLEAANGKSNKEIASMMRTREATVCKWRVRFEREGFEGLHDDFRAGRPKVKATLEEMAPKILAKLDEPPPEGFSVWNGTLLSEALGMRDYDVWAVLRKLGINLQRRRSWCVSTDPEFAQKSADIVGLYLSPPENAVVLSVDEKPAIQALDRKQGFLQLPDGKAITGFAHEYKRNGTTNLMAAFDVVTGKVTGKCYKRKTREDFLDFLDIIVKDNPGKDIHIILDNLSVHKIPPDHPWRLKRPQVHFHFTPTHSSWINQVEAWFSILSRKALKGSSFPSVKDLIVRIQKFIEIYNQDCAPFVWTKINLKCKTFESKYANIYN